MIPLEALGFERTDLTALGIRTGPEGAEALFEDFRGRIDAYREARDYPGVKGVSYLSVHLRFGTISIRRLVRFALERGGEGASTWLGELIWREFYQQVLWRRPDTVEHAFQRGFDDIDYPNDETLFAAWRGARTGYPLVDAAMRQLVETGWMHNRLRMVTASFLTKDLLVDWRWGERWFAETADRLRHGLEPRRLAVVGQRRLRRPALVPHLQPRDPERAVRRGGPVHPAVCPGAGRSDRQGPACALAGQAGGARGRRRRAGRDLPRPDRRPRRAAAQGAGAVRNRRGG